MQARAIHTNDALGSSGSRGASCGGTIETGADVDVFHFDTAAGTGSFTVSGPAPDSNLDVKGALVSANGQVLQTSNPATLGASLSRYVPADTFFLRGDGVGPGDPLSPENRITSVSATPSSSAPWPRSAL